MAWHQQTNTQPSVLTADKKVRELPEKYAQMGIFPVENGHIFCSYAFTIVHTRQYAAYGCTGAEVLCIKQAFAHAKQSTFKFAATGQRSLPLIGHCKHAPSCYWLDLSSQ